ncbi:unnamed protein product [Prorocentrum cordatum]|uniref:Uncharacterized protein n=1 Tax=Prorocentrum cordatum TaxID=2364126 RepID=A0ABN9SX24_9DINO|nr:unnamed protein product [Polarella glacialis]
MGARKRQGSADAEGAPACKVALPRRGKASGSGADPVACARCSEPVDRQSGFRGKASGRGGLPMHGCDQCYTGFIRHFQQDMAWQDFVERCHEDGDFNKDRESKWQADSELAASIEDALVEHGSVEVDVIYGQEISKTSIQLSKDQWTEKVCPKSVAGISPEMCMVGETRVASSTQPGVSSTGVVCQHPSRPYTEIKNYTRTEVRMSTVKITAAKAAASGGEQPTFKQEITKIRQKQATILRGNAKVPTLAQLQDIAASEATSRGLLGLYRSPSFGRQLCDAGQGCYSHVVADREAFVRSLGCRGFASMRTWITCSRSRPIEVVPKAAQGALANDKIRWEQLKQDVVISDILDGALKGDRVYSLKRFKPQSPSMAIMAETLYKKAETATLLSNNLSEMSWDQICAHLKVLSNEEVESASSFSQDLLRKYLQLAEPTIDQITDAIVPVAACADAFNMYEPKLSSMTGSIDSRVAVSREILMDIVVLPGLEKPALVDHMQALGIRLTDQFRATMPEWSASVKDYYEKGLDALTSAISSIGHWRKTCRGKASSTLKAEQAVEDTIKRLATTIIDSSEALVNLDVLGKLEEIMHHFSVAAEFALVEDGGRLAGMYARLLDKRNAAETCRGETEILEAARKYLSDPIENNADALHNTLQRNMKVAIGGETEITVIARTVALLHQTIELLRTSDVDELVKGPEFSTLVRRGMLLEGIGDLLMKTIKHDGDGSSLRVAINMRGYDVRSNLQMAQLFAKFLCTTTDQDADYQMIKDAFDELSSMMKVLPATAQYGFEDFKAFSAIVDPWKPAAVNAMNMYSQSRVGEAVRAASEVSKKLASIAGGMSDGSGWLDSFVGDQSSFDEIYAHMRTTIFRQIGISNKIKSLERELREKQADFTKIAGDFNVPELGFKEARDEWQQTMAKANLTVSVASLAQSVSSKGPQSVDALQRSIDAMQARSVAVEAIPPALWAEVQRKLAQ